VKYGNDQFINFIDLSIGVLQEGDTLAPYLFVIVVDYVMTVALADQVSRLEDCKQSWNYYWYQDP
jgi:hypothetical protein